MKELRCKNVNDKLKKICNYLLFKYEGELQIDISIKCKVCKKITKTGENIKK